MLTHNNLMYQLANLTHFLSPQLGDTTLSLLPPWHIYERSVGYFIFSKGCQQVGCVRRMHVSVAWLSEYVAGLLQGVQHDRWAARAAYNV